MKTKIEIKSVFGNLLFEFEKENNTIKETLLQAIKSGANLHGAYLSGANLHGANLSGANLSGANLHGAYLSGAYLSDANLHGANLSDANLHGANLSGANLSGANLHGANLSGANLSDANLRGANLHGANYNESTSFLLNQCPSEGSFIGWKKANNYIIKLLITEKAKRSSATSLKCRCSEAKVLEIQNIDGSFSDKKEVCSTYDKLFIYKIDEIVSVDNFDDDRWNECSTGIHFFISREMAVKY